VSLNGIYSDDATETQFIKEMEILPFYSQYIFSLSMYVVNNVHLFTKNMEIHSHNTRSASNLRVPVANITKYKKEPTIWVARFVIIFPIAKRIYPKKKGF
jgi:hypothetical protein